MEMNMNEYKERRRELFDLVDRMGALSEKIRLHSLCLTVFEAVLNGDLQDLPADADLHGFLQILHSYVDHVEEEARALFGDFFDGVHALMKRIAPPEWKSISEQMEESDHDRKGGQR